MIPWTTPSLTCSMPEEIDCDYVILTIKQKDVLIEKTVQAADIVDGQFTVTFTQSETGQFDASDVGALVKAQLNIIKNSTRIATETVFLELSENLHNEAI